MNTRSTAPTEKPATAGAAEVSPNNRRSDRTPRPQSAPSTPLALFREIELLLSIPAPPSSRWHRAGMSPRTEKVFDVVAILLLCLFATGWSWSIATAYAGESELPGVSPATAGIATALTNPDAPTAAFLTDLAVRAFMPMRGESGQLRAHFQLPGEALPVDAEGAHLQVEPGDELAWESAGPLIGGAEVEAEMARPRAPGIWQLAIRAGNLVRPLADLSVITLRPFSDKRGGRIGLYYIGNWPNEKGGGSDAYSPPRGFIEVTPENRGVSVSEHFRLGDFLTKGQETVWPKYLVLDTKLLDKLELILADLKERGHNTTGVKVLSGFRTPSYNDGGGDPRGRASLSRHMYGDAADIFIDNTGNGRMDDLNGDGRVDILDARVIAEAAERVERAHPELVGGIGIYRATSAHAGFVHIDTRGFAARW